MKKYINLLQSHEPLMDAGEYEITVEQSLEVKSKGISKAFDKTVRKFYVFGDRFLLEPGSVHSMYPPPGSRGDHANIFPHIILNRSTLPWERSVDGEREGIWLALLLFDGEEAPRPKNVKLKEVYGEAIGAAKEPGDGPPDQPVTVIDVLPELLKQVMPGRAGLLYAAHSRRESVGDDKETANPIKSSERSVIIGNRLPKPDGLSTVHLVSLENRFLDKGGFDDSKTTTDGHIRLVSLASWSFSSIEPKYNLTGMLKKLDRDTSLPARPYSGDFGPLRDLLGSGFTALPHHLRKGSKTVSWYRGPLSVRNNGLGFDLPAASADQLLVFDKGMGMFDVSYAAAWQLGRLMALEDRSFSLLLYQLKRWQSLSEKREQQSAKAHLQLGLTNLSGSVEKLRQKVRNWLRRCHLLEKVPFHYLVPDASMLPPESIRFFHIDPLWVTCLKDGAASIGRTSTDDLERDKKAYLADEPVGQLSGFLLRSELVSGYPGLQILGYDKKYGDDDNPKESEAMKMVRRVKLSDEVLLCIFEGENKKDLMTVDFFQKPDVLNFGMDRDEGGFYKQLRHSNGKELPDDKKDSYFRFAGKGVIDDYRMVNFDRLSTEVRSHLLASKSIKDKDREEFDQFTSADFALQMLEGGDRVRFVRE